MILSRLSIGMAIKVARERRNMTLQAVADAAVIINMTTLSRSENGLRDLSFVEVVAIARVTKVDLAWIAKLAETLDRSAELQTMTRKVREASAQLEEVRKDTISKAMRKNTISKAIESKGELL